jgi:membrane protease subunit HflK
MGAMALFFLRPASYKGRMSGTFGQAAPAGATLNDNSGGPWGGRGGGGSGDGGGGDGGGLGPRNPWSQPPRKRPPGGGNGSGNGGGNGPSALDELLRRGRESFGGGFPAPRGKPMWMWVALLIGCVWVLTTSVHQIDSQERGVLIRLGRYSATLRPGISISLPAPLDRVVKVQVENIRVIDIGSSSDNSQNLMLTGDQNIVDLAYSVRWNVRDPELYIFELADPDDTIREVAESVMRAEVARVTLDEAIGPQRSQIEDRVARRMQEILDGYRAGVMVQGIAIKQADPPAAVNDAFKAVSAAQQEAQSFLNQARSYAQQLGQRAEGDAAAFDRVYAQYRLAPEVTRKRMYYETMEKVLAKTDKTIIEAPGVTPYLPLPAIQRGAAK